MSRENAQINLLDEIIVDNFAGGGGASTGIELATGRPVTIAINHDPAAILMHKTNHPYTQHLQASVWDVDPVEVCAGRPVGLAWFSPDCFEAGTLILTTEGYKPIEEIREGDCVLTHKNRWRKVTATMKTLRDEMIVKGYGHPGIVCSTGHPFYVRERSEVWNNDRRNYDHQYSAPVWKKAKELTPKDYWGMPIEIEQLPIPLMTKSSSKCSVLPIDKRLLWLAGRYVGDGWSRLSEKRGELVICCGPQDIEYLQKNLDMWPRTGLRCKDGELAWHFRKVRTGGQFTCSNRSLVQWLRENFGHLAGEKKIPAWLFGSNIFLRGAFLAGYLSADGYEKDGLVEATTVSKKLAYGLKTLAGTVGFSPMVYAADAPGRPIEGRVVNTRAQFRVKWRRAVEEKHRQTFTEDGVLWAPIKETTVTGNQKEFYNISVDEDESYIAEGVIVHNCKHFSKAKGSALVDRNIRGLAWIVLRWAGTVRPRVVILENVEEFQTWGPVRKGKPVKKKAGETFKKWLKQLQDLGYQVEHRELVAADYGAPTTRKRFVLVARCDGKPIVWPERTHAPADSEEVKSGKYKPWRSAAEIINWSLPMYSIFASKQEIKEKYGVNVVRPLAANTQRRVIRGVDKYTIKSGKPFIAECNHSGGGHISGTDTPLGTITQKCTKGIVAANLIQYHTEQTENVRANGLSEPLPTVDASNRYGLTAVHLTEYYGNGNPLDVREPMHTVTGHDREALTAVHIQKYFGGVVGADASDPLPTVTAIDHNALTAAHVVKFKGDNLGQSPAEPMQTVTAGGGGFAVASVRIEKYAPGTQSLGHWPEIRALLNKYCDYKLAEDEILLLNLGGTWYYLSDISMRMLTPRELYSAMGFPDDYVIDKDYTGKDYPKTAQVARCGNAVCPPMATAVVKANMPEWCQVTYVDMAALMQAVAI